LSEIVSGEGDVKYLLLMMMVAAGGFLAFGCTQGEECANVYVPDLSWDEIREICQRREALEGRLRSTQRFHDSLGGIKRDLWRGKLTLAAAADALCEAGTREGHTFRRVLDGEETLSQRERMALLLLRHLREEKSAGTAPSGRVSVADELGCELASWPGLNPAALDALAAEKDWVAESLSDNASAP
jgi:hypothetical protein